MNGHVGEIVELLGPDGAVFGFALEFLRQAAGLMDVVVLVVVGGGLDQTQVGAVKVQQFDFLLALALRHHHHTFVAQGVGDQGQADAGIAGGALDDGAAGLQ